TKERPLFARAQARECVAAAWSFRLAIPGSTETTGHPCPVPSGSRSRTDGRWSGKVKNKNKNKGTARQGKARQGKRPEKRRERQFPTLAKGGIAATQ
ncbi:MAG: hypothetical protein M3414_00915, partial [Pseudomonadota bacterium]|nr:hypothetical protein [Pseudomonadota bacterium]